MATITSALLLHHFVISKYYDYIRLTCASLVSPLIIGEAEEILQMLYMSPLSPY